MAPPAPERPSGEMTALLPQGEVPMVAPMAAAASSMRLRVASREAEPLPAHAMRVEEIERTRLFIRMGWVLSVVAGASVFVIHAPLVLAVLFVIGMAIGVVVSAIYHRAFADPARYTERALMTLAVICVINGHLAVLLYGAFTASPLMIVIGIHFVARTEAERVARGILAVAVIAYAAIAAAILSGAIADPGVFASDRPVPRAALAAGAAFVLATFGLAYYTARQFRAASLEAIEDLQRATRVASQREALMDELRRDLERALRAGPGRYTDHTIRGAGGRTFRLGAVIGRGAMGEVYDAIQLPEGTPAAVKLLRREHVGDAVQRARFARELRAGRELASPHVVRLLDGDADTALPFLALERLHGHTLAEVLRHEPRLPPAALLGLCRQVGAAIDAAAAAGVVHRDLKPQNLWLGVDGTWKVLDLGVALLDGDPGAPGDERGVVGTPHYMAPEQAQGRRADTRSDLHALGAIVYRCATGRQPFDAADPAALLYAVVHRMPARPGAVADLPADFDRWCALALAKAADQRFASGAALAQALAAALDGVLAAPLRVRADAAIARLPWEPA